MDNYPLLNLFWTMLELFLWILWFFLLFRIITDLFRSHDLSGWAKAAWNDLRHRPAVPRRTRLRDRARPLHDERDVEQAQKSDAAFRAYIRDAAAQLPRGPAPEPALAPVRLGRRVADVRPERRVALLCLFHVPLGHGAAAHDHVDEYAEERQDDDEDHPGGLGPSAQVVAAEEVGD